MSTTFSLEQWAEIDSRISHCNDLLYQACLENTNASKNIPPLSSGSVGATISLGNPSSVLPLSSAPPMPMNYFPTHTNQIVATPIKPIMSMPSSVAMPNQTLPIGGNTARSLPNYGSVYMPQFTHVPANPTPPMPLPQASSSTADDALANFREEMAKML